MVHLRFAHTYTFLNVSKSFSATLTKVKKAFFLAHLRSVDVDGLIGSLHSGRKISKRNINKV